MLSTVHKTSLSAVDYPLRAVTIFQSSTAELTRTITVDLKSGRNILEIKGISNLVDKDSPRIHGLGADARVFDISCDTNLASAPGPRYRKDAQAVKELITRIHALELERDVRQNEDDILENAIKSLANGKPMELDSFMDSIMRRMRAAMEAVWECKEQIAAVEKELWLLTDGNEGEIPGRVIATIISKRECKLVFQLTYLVTGVSWTPHYDLHATTTEGRPSPEVSLLYCANITQHTGEDWTDTVLTLSTANSQALRDLTVPVLRPLKVTPQHPVASLFGPRSTQPKQARAAGLRAPTIIQARGRAASPTSSSGWPASGGWYHAAPTEVEVEEAEESDNGADTAGPPTTVNRSPLSLSYKVEGLVTIPSDGIAHKVSIAMLDFRADLKYVCVPRQNTSVFIEGTIKNTSEYELLAGPVSVFMDDSFVMKTSLELISMNESFDCVFGVDAALRVTYSQRSHTEHERARSFAEPTKTTTRTMTTTVTNGHVFDISNLIIRDAIPLGNEDENISVMLRKPDGLAQIKDGEEVAVHLGGDVTDVKARWSKVRNGKGGEKDGMYEWACTAVPAGKTATLEAQFAVKAPKDLDWEETVNEDGEQKGPSWHELGILSTPV